jgi:exodeoxyribonuclease V alpha subunit
MTVHKSQGSEFDMVLLLVPDTAGPLMTREILYTALTRARYFAGISATPRSLDRCIARTMERDSGIRERLDSEG